MVLETRIANAGTPTLLLPVNWQAFMRGDIAQLGHFQSENTQGFAKGRAVVSNRLGCHFASAKWFEERPILKIVGIPGPIVDARVPDWG